MKHLDLCIDNDLYERILEKMRSDVNFTITESHIDYAVERYLEEFIESAFKK